MLRVDYNYTAVRNGILRVGSPPRLGVLVSEHRRHWAHMQMITIMSIITIAQPPEAQTSSHRWGEIRVWLCWMPEELVVICCTVDGRIVGRQKDKWHRRKTDCDDRCGFYFVYFIMSNPRTVEVSRSP